MKSDMNKKVESMPTSEGLEETLSDAAMNDPSPPGPSGIISKYKEGKCGPLSCYRTVSAQRTLILLLSIH